MTHTPERWEWDGKSPRITIKREVRDKWFPQGKVMSLEVARVGVGGVGGCRLPQEEIMANGALIRASPVLLNVVERCLIHFEQIEGSSMLISEAELERLCREAVNFARTGTAYPGLAPDHPSRIASDARYKG